jgi:hypothetical protein
VCRSVAEKLGYEWGINPIPTHDYHHGMNQMYFMDVDFGKSTEGIQFQDFHEKWTNYNFGGDDVNITMLDPRVWDIKDGSRLIGDNGAYGGLYQAEDYFQGIEDNVRKWFTIKSEYVEIYDNKLKEIGVNLDENTCIINFRGGEYRGISKVLCRKEYWSDSVNYMSSLNNNMNFVVITDDPECANWFMPFPMKIHHVDIGFDFYVVNKSKWTIISNSSFGWWAAWLNTDSNLIIAPKYFSAHNFSDGFWALGNSYTKRFSYMDRSGNISEYLECKKEAEEYYKLNNIKWK